MLFIVLAVGGLSLLILFVSNKQYENLAYEQEKRTIDRILHIKIEEKVKELNQLSRDMADFINQEEGFRQAVKQKNQSVLTEILNDQFAQYYVTTNQLSVVKIAVFDQAFQALAWSEKGINIDSTPICSSLINQTQQRPKSHRLRTIYGLCSHEGHAYFALIAPAGGLRFSGYILILIDPVTSMSHMSEELGAPIKIVQANGEISFQSSSWPDQQSLDQYVVIKHNHPLNHRFNNHSLHGDEELQDVVGNALVLARVAINRADFENALNRVGNISFMIAMILGAVGLMVAVIVINFALKPMMRLKRSAASLLEGQYIAIGETRFKELSDISQNFDFIARQLAELIENLKLAREEAESANQTKSKFLANMSHEIRTPLTAIIGYAETLLETDLSRDEKITAVTTIINSGQHLRELINDILDLSKIEANKLAVEQIEVNPFEVLADLQSLFAAQAHEKNLEFAICFETAMPMSLLTDPIRLKQILLNLCSNAIKFTHEGFIKIKVSFVEQTRQLKFDCIDSGIGMTSEQVDKVFDAFTQADNSTTRKYGGTGLGLTLSRQLAEKLGGSLTLESEAGRGSCFTLLLPLGIEAGELCHTPDSILDKQISHIATISFKKNYSGQILIAEDTPALQGLVSMYARKLGASVNLVDNGRSAVDAAMEKSYDLILMDIEMPIMGGEDAIKSLRQQHYTKPIIAMTANAMLSDVEHYKALGCDDVITKPIDRNYFARVVSSYLQKTETTTHEVEPVISNLLEDEPDFLDLIVKYVAALPNDCRRIKEACDNHQWNNLKKELHVLKGTGGGFGYPQISDLAKEMEFMVKAGQFHKLDTFVDELLLLCEAVVLGINEHQIPRNENLSD